MDSARNYAHLLAIVPLIYGRVRGVGVGFRVRVGVEFRVRVGVSLISARTMSGPTEPARNPTTSFLTATT